MARSPFLFPLLILVLLRFVLLVVVIIIIIFLNSHSYRGVGSTLIDPDSVIRIEDLLFLGVARSDKQIHNGMFKQIQIILQRLLLRTVTG